MIETNHWGGPIKSPVTASQKSLRQKTQIVWSIENSLIHLLISWDNRSSEAYFSIGSEKLLP